MTGARKTSAAALAAAALLLGLALTALLAAREDYALARDLILARGTGYTALVLLAASLSMSPIARARALLTDRAPAPILAALRRSFGLAAATAAALHAACTFTVELVAELELLYYEPHLRDGAAALATLAILAATSFPRVVRALHIERWKELHALAYAAALLALVHLALSSKAPVQAIVLAAVITAALALGRLIPRRAK